MIKLIKSLYYKIICYDPVIEELYNHEDIIKNGNSSNYVASPIIINRKIRRNSKKIQRENNRDK
mgnify:CR=1 FL=1